MAQLRLTLGFKLGEKGWTESFYFNGTYAAAKAAGILWAEKRNLILCHAVTIKELFIRGVEKGQPTDYDPLLSIVNGALPGTNRPDNYNSAVNVRFTTTSGFLSKPWLHGIPDDWIESTAAGIPFLIATGVGLIDTYLAALPALGLQIRGQSRNGALTTPKRIQSITTLAGVTTIVAPGFAPAEDSLVLINACKGYRASQYNGEWRVVDSPVANTFVLSSTKSIDPTFFYQPLSGTARKVLPEYEGVSVGTRRKVGTRRIGRIPNVSAGRR